MSGPIQQAAGTPAMAELLQQLRQLMPEGTSVFVVAIGQIDGGTGMREVALGGPLEDPVALQAAQVALLNRGKLIGGVAIKSRMH